MLQTAEAEQYEGCKGLLQTGEPRQYEGSKGLLQAAVAHQYEGCKEVLAALDLAGCEHAQEHDDHVADHAVPHVALQGLHGQGVLGPQGIQLVNNDLHGVLKHQLLIPMVHHLLLPLPDAGHYPVRQSHMCRLAEEHVMSTCLVA